MKLIDALNLLSQIAKEMGTSTPYICGGTPRDKVMGRPMVVEDIDLTTGDQSIHILARELARRSGGNYKEMPDGHSQLILNGLKLDFSTNYIEPGVDSMLINAGLLNPSIMQQELYSRDFTCNSLLMTIDLKKILDPTGLGFQDIQSKILRTCLPAKITLGSDPKRVARVIYMATKLNFNVDQEIIDWVRKNPQSIVPDGNSEYTTKKINQALDYDSNMVVNLINTMGLWSYVPPSERLMPYISQNVGRII